MQKNARLFCLFLPLVKSNKQQTNTCRWNHVELEGNLQLFENLNDADIISMPMIAMSRAQFEHSILFVMLVNRFCERQICGGQRQFQRFDHGFVRMKGEKTLYLSDWNIFCLC